MLSVTQSAGLAVEPPYRVSRCPDLDGVADGLYRASIAGAGASYYGSCAVSLRRDAGGALAFFSSRKSTDPFTVQFGFDSTDHLKLIFYTGLEWTSTAAIAAGAAWRTLAFKWDLSSPTAKTLTALMGGAALAGTLTDSTGAPYSVPWGTHDQVAVGSTYNVANFHSGGIADFWLHTSAQFADAGTIYDAAGKPLYLGDDGDIPTGTPAAIYLRSDYDTWGKNSGTGGDFVMQSAPWAAASTTPSD